MTLGIVACQNHKQAYTQYQIAVDATDAAHQRHASATRAAVASAKATEAENARMKYERGAAAATGTREINVTNPPIAWAPIAAV